MLYIELYRCEYILLCTKTTEFGSHFMWPNHFSHTNYAYQLLWAGSFDQQCCFCQPTGKLFSCKFVYRFY